jgi:hypothetical protein
VFIIVYRNDEIQYIAWNETFRLTDGITKRSRDTNGNIECFSCSVDVRCRGRDQVHVNWAVKRIEIIT